MEVGSISYLYEDARAMNSIAEIHTQKSKVFKGSR